MSELPQGWKVVSLEELFEVNYGKGLIQERRIQTGNFHVYGSAGVVGQHNEAHTTGPTIIIGRKGSAGEVSFSTNQCWVIDTAYFIDKFFQGIPAHFWAFYLKYLQLGKKDKSSAIPSLSRDDIYETEVNIPPLNEQYRIVAKLEQVLGKVADCQARLEKIPKLLARFRQSVLAAAYSGRLTADWRAKQPSELQGIDEILKSLKEKRLRRAKTVSSTEKIEEIYSTIETSDSDLLPPSWQYVSLAKLCDSFDYGTSTKSQKEGLVAVLRMGNIQDGNIEWEDLVFTSDPEEIEKYRLKPGTVLFNRTNSPELVGKTAIYRGEREAIFAGYLIRVNNFECLDSEYLNFCLNTLNAREFCSNVKTDGVSQSNINAQKLGTFEIAYCSLTEQKEIVRRVEELFKYADQLEERYRTAKANIDKLTQSILAKAFRGELVPQDPNDEPASVLLERIRAERDSQSPSPKKKRGPGAKKAKATPPAEPKRPAEQALLF
jgi:type I restriction enzyme S subunit